MKAQRKKKYNTFAAKSRLSCVKSLILSTFVSSNFIQYYTSHTIKTTISPLSFVFFHCLSLCVWWYCCTKKSLLFHCCWALRFEIGYDIWTLFEVFINLTLLFSRQHRTGTTTRTTTKNGEIRSTEKRDENIKNVLHTIHLSKDIII